MVLSILCSRSVVIIGRRKWFAHVCVLLICEAVSMTHLSLVFWLINQSTSSSESGVHLQNALTCFCLNQNNHTECNLGIQRHNIRKALLRFWLPSAHPSALTGSEIAKFCCADDIGTTLLRAGGRLCERHVNTVELRVKLYDMMYY